LLLVPVGLLTTTTTTKNATRGHDDSRFAAAQAEAAASQRRAQSARPGAGGSNTNGGGGGDGSEGKSDWWTKMKATFKGKPTKDEPSMQVSRELKFRAERGAALTGDGFQN